MAVNLPLSEAQLRSLILGVKTNYLPKTNYLVKTNCEDEFAEDELPAEDEFRRRIPLGCTDLRLW